MEPLVGAILRLRRRAGDTGRQENRHLRHVVGTRFHNGGEPRRHRDGMPRVLALPRAAGHLRHVILRRGGHDVVGPHGFRQLQRLLQQLRVSRTIYGIREMDGRMDHARRARQAVHDKRHDSTAPQRRQGVCHIQRRQPRRVLYPGEQAGMQMGHTVPGPQAGTRNVCHAHRL